jgi:taurine dioxygenase
MLTVEPTGAVLGATVWGLDLAQPLDKSDMGRILLALGRHGVLRFPDQLLDLASLQGFSELFGEIQRKPIRDADPANEYPEIGILSPGARADISDTGAWQPPFRGSC